MSAGSRDAQHECRDGMPQQHRLGQSSATTIEKVMAGVLRTAKEGANTPRTRDRLDATKKMCLATKMEEARRLDATKKMCLATKMDEARTTTTTTKKKRRRILTIDNAAREGRFSNVCTAGGGPYSRRPSTQEAEWISATGRRLEGELSGSVGRRLGPRGGLAAVRGGAFDPSRWAVPPTYPDATIVFVTVRERLTSVPGHNLRAGANDGIRRMCIQMCKMCKPNWAMWLGDNFGHFQAKTPTSVLIELVPVGS